ncbi:LysM peptidoglycan-binding domain-containing protein [Granulicella sp. L60]|jgi:nucleoid-associated protein YgaU|uniref:LysM peptidoglycan-binding domain-containing protein n=1 Tax=Granulicella sp. L60 TaxID=1641866 RepID=UPI00131AA7BC|nr:LysM peptidoglycan-binding domain-containing protein [Granulicella sp. L60]
MADLDQLKQKYAPVIEGIEKFIPYGATLETVDLTGEQLHIRGTVPSTVVANRIWGYIKKCDPTYSDLHHEIGTTGGETQPYTIKSGDTLSAISLLFYGNANKYPQIAQANNIADPNKVPIGTTLQLPVLT